MIKDSYIERTCLKCKETFVYFYTGGNYKNYCNNCNPTTNKHTSSYYYLGSVY